MSQPHNPYGNKAPHALHTGNDDNVSMHDSPSSKNLGFDESKHELDKEHDEEESMQGRNNANKEDKEEINFDENHFQIPPSFNRNITEETLQDNDQPYIFWALLCLPIPKDHQSVRLCRMAQST